MRILGPRFALPAALVAAALFAPPARADELYGSVERTAAPGERALVKLRSDVPGPARLLLFRVEEPAALLASGIDLTRGETALPRLAASLSRAIAEAPRAGAPAIPAVEGDAPAGSAVDARLSFISSTAAALPAAAREGASETVVEVALPSSGLYLVEVRRGDRRLLLPALSSRLVLVTKRDASRLLVWAVDRTSGTPIDRVAVEATAAGKAVASGTTDARGLVSLAVSGTPTLDVRGTRGDDWAFGAETWFPAGAADRRVHAFTNQPAYRPGERVEAKGIVRAVRDGESVLDDGAREAVVRFLAAGDRELGRVTAPISADLGTFAAGLDLPKDAPLGDATLLVEIGGKSYAAPFRIEEYRRPTFEVTVAATPARVGARAPVEFRVAAALFEGGPVANAPVTWTLSYHRVDRDLFPADDLARLFFGTEREAYADVPAGAGEAKLDAQGRATISVTAPDSLPGTGALEDGFLTLRTNVVGPDRTVVAGAGTAAFDAKPLTVALKTDKHLYGAEGVAHVTVRAVLAGGAPAAGRAGALSASLERKGRAAVPGEERLTGAVPFTTGPDGTATLDVPFSENGRWALTAALPRAASEPAGPAVSGTVHVWVAGERADVGFSGDRLEVVADKDTYAVGDVARLLVLSPAGGRPFLSTIEGARLLSFDLVALPGPDDRGSSALVELKVEAAHAPNAFVGVALVDHGNVLSTTKLLRVPPVEKVLTPVVMAARPELEPGAVTTLRVAVTDRGGRPAAGAEVAVAVVDDSLYALYADPAAPLAPFFHPARRNEVRTGGPVHLLSTAYSIGTERAEHGVTVASGAVPAPATSAPPPPSPAAPRPARDGGAPAEAPRGEEPGMGDGGGGAVRARNGAAALGDADDRLSEGKKSKDGSAGEGPLEARADFRASVAWFAAVRTGPDGTADLGEVKFADSLTRWRITANAVDAATRVGTSTTTVRTAKKVLTRVTLPRFLRAGDSVEAPWILHSLLEAPAEARYVASVTGLTLKGQAQGAETLAPGAVVAHDLLLLAPAVGPASVRAELRTDAGSDAIEQRIPVLPLGIGKTLVTMGFAEGPMSLPPLSLPPTAEAGTARLKVVVTPTYAQAVGAALPYLLDYPYGCTEQTMSRLVSVVVAKAARDAFHVPLRGRLEELPKMLDAGLSRLEALQHRDGGFGWWPTDASDLPMTAYVVHGLSRAIAVAEDPARARAILDRSAAWLAAARAAAPKDRTATAVDAFVLMALADAGKLSPADLPPAFGDGVVVVPPLQRAFWLRAAIAAKAPAKDVETHLQSLLLHAVRDASGTHWFDAGGVPAARTGRGPAWEDDGVEANAWVLGALLAADPKHPDLAGGARWLLAQRRGGDRWKSTRDTAVCVAFLTRLAAATGDLGAGRSVGVSLGGVPLRKVVVTPETAFTADATIEVDAAALPAGPLVVSVAPEGGSAVVAASLSFTETGPAIGATNAGYSVERRFYLLEPSGPGGALRRRPVTETVPSGALLDVDVAVTTERAQEFVMVTSPLAAGFEPEKAFGAYDGAGPAKAVRPDHEETRDDREVFFVKAMTPGTHVFRHRVRATHVGGFSALPAQAECMYFPDVRGNGRGETFEVSKGAPAGREEGK